MKAFRKLIIITLIVLACAAAVFFFGWTQFFVPAGKYGVMLSKSGGYYPPRSTLFSLHDALPIFKDVHQMLRYWYLILHRGK